MLWGIWMSLAAQGTELPRWNPAYHTVDRLSILTGLNPAVHSSLKPYDRASVTQYALRLDTAVQDLSRLDRFDLQYIFLENNEWLGEPVAKLPLAMRRCDPLAPTQIEAAMADTHFVFSKRPILKYFYQTPANLFDINDRHFYMRLNPVLNLSYGAGGDDEAVLYNLRGLETRGGIDDRLFFYLNILETQAALPNYVDDWTLDTRALPGQGLYKEFKLAGQNGYDFLNSQGYLNFQVTPHIGMAFGYGQHFLGNGIRSALLSDFSNNYLYLRFDWRVWRFHYWNLFTELAAQSANANQGDVVLPKKYMAAHHFSFDISPSLNIGLFEAVVFNRNQFELHYLNPVILYRTVEQAVGSPDNVLIGLDGRWNLLRRFQLYGQFILDEFLFSELFIERRGWWANKWALQAGIKYVNALGIDHLDLQFELNVARPFTYTYSDSSASYTHYSQPLAHPLGANFSEAVARLQYRPLPRLFIEGRLFRMRQGEDDIGANYGGNLLLSNLTRVSEFGNEILQGVRGDTWLGSLDVSYMLWHNFFLDLRLLRRQKDSTANARDLSTQFISLGLRWNAGLNRWEF